MALSFIHILIYSLIFAIFLVFKPFVELLTDPDFFNRNLINYIEKANQQQINLPKKALEHVELYIEKVNDVQVLKQIR